MKYKTILILALIYAIPSLAEVEPNDDVYLASILDSGSTVGRLDTVDDIDYYSVLVEDTSILTINLSLEAGQSRDWPYAVSDWKVSVYSPAGTPIASFVANLIEPFSKSIRTDSDGEYLIKIEVGDSFYYDATYVLNTVASAPVGERDDALADFSGIWKADGIIDFISVHQNRDTAILTVFSVNSTWDSYYGDVTQNTVYTSLLFGDTNLELEITLIEPDIAISTVMSCSGDCQYRPGHTFYLKRVFKQQPPLPFEDAD